MLKEKLHFSIQGTYVNSPNKNMSEWYESQALSKLV
jgi:hypothetical protein